MLTDLHYNPDCLNSFSILLITIHKLVANKHDTNMLLTITPLSCGQCHPYNGGTHIEFNKGLPVTSMGFTLA